MQETILSTGIDIGTTTTHLIISRIGIMLEQNFGCAPKANITEKEILYQSPIYFTPLTENGLIDGEKVAQIISHEYEKAGVTPDDLKSGAVIVTGESSKKRNAKEVLESISNLCGNFIATQAGSELESFLAGKGAGADVLSESSGKTVANIDIGGGTTNISIFSDGECVDDACLNIGSRLVNSKNKITVTPSIIKLCEDQGLVINDLTSPETDELCRIFAQYIRKAINNEPIPDYMITDHPLTGKYVPEIITFSGGVGELIKDESQEHDYCDLGVNLAKTIKSDLTNYNAEIAVIKDSPIRATVIGTGNFSMEISGSTIQYSTIKLPLKSLECINDLSKPITKPCAICPKMNDEVPSFNDIQLLAKDIKDKCTSLIDNGLPIIVVTKHDCSKALGICLRHILPKDHPFICIDGINCKRGNYIDIGEPIALGNAVPVVVKTLIFGGEK